MEQVVGFGRVVVQCTKRCTKVFSAGFLELFILPSSAFSTYFLYALILVLLACSLYEGVARAARLRK